MIPSKDNQRPIKYFMCDKDPDMMKKLPALGKICEYLGEGWIYSINGVIQYPQNFQRRERFHFWKKK